MGFFDMGPLEILLILIVTLIIWGPAKIPEIARTLGRTVRVFRKATSDLTATVTKELNLDEQDHPSQSKLNSSDKTQESSDGDKAESSDLEMTRPRDQ